MKAPNISVITNIVTDIINKKNNNENLTEHGVRKTVLARSLEIFKNKKELSELTEKDYKNYSDTIDKTLSQLSDKGVEQAQSIKKDINKVLGGLKKKIFKALKEKVIEMTTGIPDGFFDALDVSKEVKKTFRPTLNPYKTDKQQYEEYIITK